MDDMVMNDQISKSNQPNAPADPAFLPSFFLPTALGTLCSPVRTAGSLRPGCCVWALCLRIICLLCVGSLSLFARQGCYIWAL